MSFDLTSPDATQPRSTEGWDAAISEVKAEWRGAVDASRAASRTRIDSWTADFDLLETEVAELKQLGRWVSGPTDLMTVIGRHRDELAHSRAVAWLLTPTAQHGLGTRVLKRILQAGWPAPEYAEPALDGVIVDREVPCGNRRADIVIRMGDVTLVIENKVDSAESAGQCEDLYQCWSGHRPDIRFLLLSPLGNAPLSTSSQEGAAAWRYMSYSGLAAAIEEAIGAAPQASAGLDAVRQYLQATWSMSFSRSPFAIHQGGGHVDG